MIGSKAVKFQWSHVTVEGVFRLSIFKGKVIHEKMLKFYIEV